VDCTFKTIVIGKKSAPTTGNLMHFLGGDRSTFTYRPQTGNQQNNRDPGADKA
jgi:hypothetical protein